jgi:hypothetical protein
MNKELEKIHNLEEFKQKDGFRIAVVNGDSSNQQI